jgi:hypothetical protein
MFVCVIHATLCLLISPLCTYFRLPILLLLHLFWGEARIMCHTHVCAWVTSSGLSEYNGFVLTFDYLMWNLYIVHVCIVLVLYFLHSASFVTRWRDLLSFSLNFVVVDLTIKCLWTYVGDNCCNILEERAASICRVIQFGSGECWSDREDNTVDQASFVRHCSNPEDNHLSSACHKNLKIWVTHN